MNFLKKYRQISKIEVDAPAPAPDRHGLAMVAIMKDEADYIAEWIEFHRLVGARAFYIYDNGSSDESAGIARHHIGADGVLMPFAGRYHDAIFKRNINPQPFAYAHAIANFGANYRWMAFIDIDEFIIPKSGDNIEQILDRELSGEVNIALPWAMFGTGGHIENPGGLTIESYTARYDETLFWPKARYPFKHILDPCEAKHVHIHLPTTKRDGDLCSNDVGARRALKSRNDEGFFSVENLQLNHYFTRSRVEFIERKAKRGVLSRDGKRYTHEWIDDTISRLESRAIEDSAAKRFAADLKKILAR